MKILVSGKKEIVKIIKIITIQVSFFSDFFDFLRREGALEKYIYNLELINNNGKPLQKIWRMSVPDWLRGSFVWSQTPEQHDYWSKLNMKWWAYLDEAKEIEARDLTPETFEFQVEGVI